MVVFPPKTVSVVITAVAVPFTFSFLAPGPTIVILELMTSGPDVSVIVPVTLMLIVSPPLEAPIACRNEPAPLSERVLTVRVVACAFPAQSRRAAAMIPHAGDL
jgi:hypothetical protein